MRYFGNSDVGRVRKINEDSHLEQSVWGKEGTLLVVCDGMGGHQAGEIASKRAVAAFSDYVACSPCLSDDPAIQMSEVRHTMIAASKSANNMILRMSRDFEELAGMGTTLVAGLVFHDTLYCVNIGDSRLYIITKGKVTQVTHDHSFVQYLLDYGKITPEEARNYPRKNVITQAVGINENAEADFFCVNLKNCGRGFILLCTDGLSNFVDSKTMLDVLYGESPQVPESKVDLEKAVNKLIAYANSGGGTDNITAVLAQF